MVKYVDEFMKHASPKNHRNCNLRPQSPKVLLMGGENGERLYLHNLKFKMPDGQKVRVLKTNEPGIDMTDLIARHKSRYGLLMLYSRPGYHVLDFPCGSGYASGLLKDFGVIYYGKDVDGATIEYARRIYKGKNVSFEVGDLCFPNLGPERYDIIGCIEGLEHIEKRYQKSLMAALYHALKPGGALIISSPENEAGISGPSKLNPFHKWELNKNDFLALLYAHFDPKDVELITHEATLSPGLVRMACLYGVCHKSPRAIIK